MYIAPGLLDRRLTFYRRAEEGGDGFARAVYVETGTYWGRIDATAQRQNIAFQPQAHIDVRTTWAATIAADIVVDTNGLVRESGSDTLYYVRGVITMRQMSGQRIDLESIDPNEYATFTLYDAAEVMDGEHLINAASAFSGGFNEGYD